MTLRQRGTIRSRSDIDKRKREPQDSLETSEEGAHDAADSVILDLCSSEHGRHASSTNGRCGQGGKGTLEQGVGDGRLWQQGVQWLVHDDVTRVDATHGMQHLSSVSVMSSE